MAGKWDKSGEEGEEEEYEEGGRGTFEQFSVASRRKGRVAMPAKFEVFRN